MMIIHPSLAVLQARWLLLEMALTASHLELMFMVFSTLTMGILFD